MEQPHQENIYEAENADKIVSDLFSGDLSLEQALQRIRTRLLDLSSRNRLLNYRHPKGRSIQFVNKPNLNLVFNRLIENNKPLLVKYVPEPPPDAYTAKRPDAKTYAQSAGIDIETEFSPDSCSSSANKHTPKLQALYYPADLDKLCRKLSSEARTVIEETGTNMLYLVFGFLEFYEREDSERPLLAPLLAVPVSIEKGGIDHDTRTYQYSIVYSGEDMHENLTLREKLNQDFALQLPEFEDEDEPGSYFTKIQRAIQKKKRWKVRYQLTLGFLSFAKLAIWDDLDSKKWPGLLKHSLLKEVFSGGSGKGGGLFPEDYEIDKHPQGDLPVIYDADSSQHSAIIDVLSGKNIVINGPPGTGKSQTITNVIAAGLKHGKKILFVSEKLAALEVVRHRLNQAGLGHFCLELHSHKTQKKKILEDLQERLDARFRPPQSLLDRISTLKRHKKDLNRYAELMASHVGNGIGLTVYEVFWATERRRQEIGDLSAALQSLFLPDAAKWSYDDIQARRARLEALGQLNAAIGSFDATHPWWGFTPQPLAPGDNEAIGRIVAEAASLCEKLFDYVASFQAESGSTEEPSLAFLEELHRAIQTLPDPPDDLNGDILPRVFGGYYSLWKQNRELLTTVIGKVERARELNGQATAQLGPGGGLDYDTTKPIVAACAQDLVPVAFSVPLNTLEECVLEAERALQGFETVAAQTSCAFAPIHAATLESLDAKLRATAPLTLGNLPLRSIQNGTSVLSREVERLAQGLERVSGIATRRGLEFDSSPTAIAHLGRPDGIQDVLPDVQVDNAILAKAQQAANYLLPEFPLSHLDKRQQALHALHDRIARALDEMSTCARQLGLPFDGTPLAVSQLASLGQIASRAPADLLDYRRASLAHPRAGELLATCEKAHATEGLWRDRLAQEFYLDALPGIEELRAAIRVFRRGDGLLNLFNGEWRSAKRLFKAFCKTKAKRRAADCAAQVADIVTWMEQRAAFIANEEFKEIFGHLFKGLDTDFSKIRRLHAWYAESRAEMLKYPRFIGAIDLSALEAGKVSQLAAQSSRIQALASELAVCGTEAQQLLGPVSHQLESTLPHSGWADYNQKLLKVASGLKNVVAFLGRYVKPDVSPKRAVEVLHAKRELLAAGDDFKALGQGLVELHKAVEPLLPGIASIPCDRWTDYLAQVAGLAHVTSTLAEFVTEYGANDATLSDIRAFLEAKVALDNQLERFA